MNDFKKVFLLCLIVGVICLTLGISGVVYAFVSPHSDVAGSKYVFGGLGCIVAGVAFLLKSIPAFYPIQKQTDN